MKSLLLRALCGLALLAGVACDHDHAAPTGKPTCTAIYERCHPVDPGTGPAHECHEFAETESTTEAQCVARRAECFAACVPVDGGTDAGAEAGTDAAADAAADVASDASGG